MEANAREIGGLGLKVTGALSGTVFVESLDSTVGSLRVEVSRLMGEHSRLASYVLGFRGLQAHLLASIYLSM